MRQSDAREGKTKEYTEETNRMKNMFIRCAKVLKIRGKLNATILLENKIGNLSETIFSL